MKTQFPPVLKRAFLIAGNLVLLATESQAGANPEITSPVNGATINQPLIDVQVSVAGISDVQSVKIRSNGTVVGNAVPTSLFGEWTFPNGSRVSVMQGHMGSGVMIDYSPPNGAPMYLMEGSFADADTFTGTFTYWDGVNPEPVHGASEVNFAFTSAGLLNVAITGESPLGTRAVSGGLSQNETYHFTWNNPPAGSQSLTAVVTHLVSATPVESTTEAVTVNVVIPKAPEIVVQQPKGSGLTDGSAKKSFGTVSVGKSGTAKSFTIKNTGTAKLTGLAITKTGSNAKEFVVTGPEKSSLIAGASTTFTVTFKPKAKGDRSAAIHIKSNDADENPFDIKLSGMGKAR